MKPMRTSLFVVGGAALAWASLGATVFGASEEIIQVQDSTIVTPRADAYGLGVVEVPPPKFSGTPPRVDPSVCPIDLRAAVAAEPVSQSFIVAVHKGKSITLRVGNTLRVAGESFVVGRIQDRTVQLHLGEQVYSCSLNSSNN